MDSKTVKLQANVRLTEEQAVFLSKTSPNVSEGVRSAIDSLMAMSKSINRPEAHAFSISDAIKSVNALMAIRTISLKELKGKFTSEEWVFLAKNLRATSVDGMFRVSTSVLISHCQDAETHTGTATKYGVDLPALIEKIKMLSPAQVDALYWRIEKFWDENKDSLKNFSNYT